MPIPDEYSGETIEINDEIAVVRIPVPGTQGPAGADSTVPGPEGPQGPQGIQGVRGEVGETGPRGLQGLPGSDGAQGLQGLKGDKGETGSQGIQGVPGVSGTPGAKGDTGNAGPKGIPGTPGTQGIQGIQGIQGNPGTTDYTQLQNIPSTFAPSAHTHSYQRLGFVTLSNDTLAQALNTNINTMLTVTANRTLTTTVMPAGEVGTVILLTSGTVSYTVTFGSGFKPVGTLATGTVTARKFRVSFMSDGVNMVEMARTAAMVV
jgi:hypothetical protein